MPGKRLTQQQLRLYKMRRSLGESQAISAAKAGMSERSGRLLEKSDYHKPPRRHNWRTRTDPFVKVWESEVVPLLEAQPSLSALTLLEDLQARHENAFPDAYLRTLQRRVKQWKAPYGPEKEVMFRQVHEPGRQGLSDFTTLKGVEITILGVPIEHLLYHFRLAYSGWSFVKVVM